LALGATRRYFDMGVPVGDEGRPDSAGLENETLRFQAGSGARNDGYLEIRYSDSGLEALASFVPPVGNGAPIPPEVVEKALSSLGITEGVDSAAISDAMLNCNLSRRPVTGVVIAKGRKPVAEIPNHLALEPAFAERRALPSIEKAFIDYKDFSPFVTVRSGQRIAHAVARVDGIAGVDVHGKEIPFPRAKVDELEPGDNVRAEGEAFVAASDGQLVFRGKRFSVEQVLAVKGVDYHTGNIIFPGDVVIEGEISEGFKVTSGGSVFCKGTMDPFEVFTRGDLTVAGGIIGHQSTHVRVGGKLTAKFVQYSRIAVRGDVFVQDSILSSQLYGLGKLEMGDRGKLVGGESYFAHGASVSELGSPKETATELHIGVDFLARQQLEEANERLRQLSLRIQKVEQILKAGPSERASQIHAQLAAMAKELQGKISDLMPKIEVDDAAIVEVRGCAYPGSGIEICHVRLEIAKPVKRSRFRLDKASGRIVAEPIA
jgi:uncharacterized protein